MAKSQHQFFPSVSWYLIYCGSGSGFVSSSGSRLILHSFSITKNLYKIRLFSMLEAALFPKKLASNFFFLLLNYILCWIRVQIPVSVKSRNRNALLFRFRWGKKLRFRFHNTASCSGYLVQKPSPLLVVPISSRVCCRAGSWCTRGG